MTLDHLKYFAAVASYQHVGRAASSLHISPSVISSAISTLEQELDCNLFNRVGRGIELTNQGKMLLEKSQVIIAKISRLKSDISEGQSSLSGHYRLGASHFLTSGALYSGWSMLQADHAQLTADLFSMNTAHALAELLGGKIDLALCFSPLEHPNLKEFKMYEGEMIPVVRKDHPVLKKTKKAKLEYLSSSPSIFHKAAQGVSSCESHPIFDKLGFQPKIDLFYDSDEIAVCAAKNSDRWSFVPDIVYRSHEKELGTFSLPRSVGRANYHVSAMIFKNRSQDPVLCTLISSIKKQLSSSAF